MNSYILNEIKIDSNSNNFNINAKYVKEKEYIMMCMNEKTFHKHKLAIANPKISIVIPVYNKVEYLDLALRSAQKQSLCDIEIVCVDDGSTDGSVDKIKSYMKYDARIKLVRNACNMGTSFTRAVSITNSIGKYVLTLDPDDSFASPKIAELAYMEAEKNKADIVHFKAIKNNSNGDDGWVKWFNHRSGKILCGDKVFSAFVENKKAWTLWGKLINRNVYLEAIRKLGADFIKCHICMAEDMIHYLIISELAKKYVFLDKFGYFYNVNRDSITQQNNIEVTEKTAKSWKLIQDRVCKIYSDHKEYKLIKSLFSIN